MGNILNFEAKKKQIEDASKMVNLKVKMVDEEGNLIEKEYDGTGFIGILMTKDDLEEEKAPEVDAIVAGGFDPNDLVYGIYRMMETALEITHQMGIRKPKTLEAIQAALHGLMKHTAFELASEVLGEDDLKKIEEVIDNALEKLEKHYEKTTKGEGLH